MQEDTVDFLRRIGLPLYSMPEPVCDGSNFTALLFPLEGCSVCYQMEHELSGYCLPVWIRSNVLRKVHTCVLAGRAVETSTIEWLFMFFCGLGCSPQPTSMALLLRSINLES